VPWLPKNFDGATMLTAPGLDTHSGRRGRMECERLVD